MKRLDIFLVENRAVKSREKAKRLIIDGKVTVGGRVVTKPSATVADDADVSVSESENEKYVGRGALKLLKAFEQFPIDVCGKACADIGASTGGFTQVLLEKGASLVYAVDVGHAQLDSLLANDSRVINCEGVNVRFLPNDFFKHKIDFVCCDLSFISLTQILPAVCAAVSDGTQFAVLIKPQFEAGREALNKKGVVKNIKDHISVLESLRSFFPTVNLSLMQITHSPICGGDGNIEYLAYLIKQPQPELKSFDMKHIAQTAFLSAK